MRFSLSEVDALDDWDIDTTRALTERCRAGVIDHWSTNVVRRHGEAAVDAILTRIPEWHTYVVGTIDPARWMPVAAHLELVRAMRETLGGGSYQPVIDDFIDDLRVNMGKVKLFGLRRLGPGPVIRQIGAIHRGTYEDGEASAEVGKGRATIRFRGARFMQHPTWQVLQLATLRALIELSGRTLGEHYVEVGEELIEVHGTWS